MLRQVATRAGFRVRRLSYSNTLTLAPAMAVRVAKSVIYKAAARRGLPRNPKTDFMTLPRPINNALISYYKLETGLLKRGRLPFGLSVIAGLQRTHETPV